MHLNFKIVSRETGAHSPAFMTAADSMEGYDAMIRASKILATSILELFHDQSRVASIQDEFRREKQKDLDRMGIILS